MPTVKAHTRNGKRVRAHTRTNSLMNDYKRATSGTMTKGHKKSAKARLAKMMAKFHKAYPQYKRKKRK